MVEKDWFVVQALAAIHDVEVDGLTLAFGGGTALGRAYRLLERMSEDIDLRIIGEKSTSRSVLKRLRSEVNDRLAAAGFAVDGHYEVKQNDKYVRYDLPYEPIARGEGVLRPEIKIELSSFPVAAAPETRSASSFVAEAKKERPEAIDVKCVRLVETAADKFVALARRAGFAFSGLGELDHTLVRHVYDLSRMDGKYDLDAAVTIALETMKAEPRRARATILLKRMIPGARHCARTRSWPAIRNLKQAVRNYLVILSTAIGGSSRRLRRRSSSPSDFARR
ncbi:nucleotidyl transferase AbiEii/AbiGii toxin family protein [Rhizobium leguminosarum]|uniref:nucleotidyl transferase AbiEii/AbiGii toxin family protein n=1 Tax=Rhizobium leguminosarum TaxID=384 RepID=UPI0021B0E148|nr:nucleotidyl transferase AbiEii/AbiGii toxin family protein [Rhizobium leguminosarum]